MSEHNWYHIKNSQELISPSLLVFPDRIRKNIELMIEIAGGVQNLRPHIKTHKIAEIVKMQQAYGIQKYKCATIAEAELLGICEAEDVLLAMQPVGTQIVRFFELIKHYPNSKFSTIVDNEITVNAMVSKAKEMGIKVSLWLDINNGMNRTGIAPNEEAKLLFTQMSKNSSIKTNGFHVYDGHIRNADINERKEVCDREFKAVLVLKEALEKVKISVKTIVAGGSATFPIHKDRVGVETSPGTPVLWDAGYAKKYKDLAFLPAAVLLTRVISNPTKKTTCLDLGHKSVASEMLFPRVQFLGANAIKQLDQHEEHLVIENDQKFVIGQELYAIPIHICPTVSKYNKVHVVFNNSVDSSWSVLARDHKLKI